MSVDDRGQEEESILVYNYSRKTKGQRKWPDVIKLKACVEHRSLLRAKGLARHQGECDYSALGEGGGGEDEVKRQSEEMKWDDI